MLCGRCQERGRGDPRGCWVGWSSSASGREASWTNRFANTSSCSTSRRCRRPGTTSCPTCRARRRRRSIRGRSSRPAPTTSPRCFPMDLILQEVSMERFIEIPGAVLDVYRQWRPSPLFRAHRLEQALDTPAAHLLQVRGSAARSAATSPTPRCPRRTTTPRPGSGSSRRRRAPASGAPRCAVGLRAVRARVRGVAGRGQLRPEALPTPDDGDVRRHGAPLPVGIHRRRPQVPGREPASHGLAGHRHLRGGRGGRPEPETSATRSAACSTTFCSTRPSSGRRPCCSWPRPVRPHPTSWSAAPVVARTSRACSFPSYARSSLAGCRPPSGRSSPPRARP